MNGNHSIDKLRRRTILQLLGAASCGLPLPLASLAGYDLQLRAFVHSGAAGDSEAGFTAALLWPAAGLCALAGGAVGFLIARYLDHHEEIEHHKAMQEILGELTLTVAHYIRNANSLIGGHSRRLIDHHEVPDPARQKLELIRKASDQIEAVVCSLQALDADVGIEAVGTTRMRMLDIRDMVERKIKQHGFGPADSERRGAASQAESM